jgi:hypothetical protein
MINIIPAFSATINIKAMVAILSVSFSKSLRTALGTLSFSWFEVYRSPRLKSIQDRLMFGSSFHKHCLKPDLIVG